MPTNREKVLNYLNKISPGRATNNDILIATEIEPHQQVFQITDNLFQSGQIQGVKNGKEWSFWIDENSISGDSVNPETVSANMNPLIRELFLKYKANPNEVWVSEYEERINQVRTFRNKPASFLTEKVLHELWMQKANGIANVGLGFMYQSEFDALQEQLPEITIKIINEPTSVKLDEIEVWAKQQKDFGNLKHITWSVIYRVFAAANPDELCTIVNKANLDQLIKTLNENYGFNISTQGNWFDRNSALLKSLKQGELANQEVHLINTFPWMLYEWLVVQAPERNASLSMEHVISAINEIDERGVNSGEKSSTYDLIHNVRCYPPKLVYSLAHKYKDGTELDRSAFEGGENTQCFSDLRGLGFIIERKDFVSELLKKFIQQADEGASLTTRDYPKTYCGLDVNVSFGQGNFSKVPWISFLGYGQKTQNGIYPVYLYYKTIKVLVLAYGVSTTNEPEVVWKFHDHKETIRDHLASEYDFQLEKYGYSYVYSSYHLPTNLTDPQVTLDLDTVIAEYHKLMGGTPTVSPAPVPPEPEPPVEPILDPEAISKSFSAALSNSNVRFGESHDARVSAFVSSLMTKPLVILTGLSGSGKTQIAIRFGEWLGKDRMLVAPVRPDWTGAEALFGYEDALKPIVNGRASWAVPDTLAFILKASNNPHWPYLLVLDEMNLAHVERYFADVLSGMESDQPCLPNLIQESDGCWRIADHGPDKITFPKNIFVVGTVNVDETTYMFSPKVLDRANTFEFRVTTDDLADDYIKPIQCKPGEIGLVRGFLEVGRDDAWHSQNVFTEATDLSQQLRHVHSMLAAHGFEFGHRVFYESQRFAAIYGATGEFNLSNVLDLIVMQKLLPRLHGSRRRLEELLRAFAKFCFNNTIETKEESIASIFEPEDKNTADAKLPVSFDKLKRMLRSLRANQFTSFTE